MKEGQKAKGEMGGREGRVTKEGRKDDRKRRKGDE
jgi:hypothetical protein